MLNKKQLITTRFETYVEKNTIYNCQFFHLQICLICPSGKEHCRQAKLGQREPSTPVVLSRAKFLKASHEDINSSPRPGGWGNLQSHPPFCHKFHQKIIIFKIRKDQRISKGLEYSALHEFWRVRVSKMIYR